MGDLVSLKLHNKRRQREDKEMAAAENRAKFGQSKNDRELTKAERVQSVKLLDSHKRDG